MREKENLAFYLVLALVFTLGIVVTAQLVLMNESTRIERVKAADYEHTYEEGKTLYQEACVDCHGQYGEGGVGPALNDKKLLTSTSDEAFFGLISIGIPGTAMPTWGQAYGGPFTAEQVHQIVVYIRAWEEGAPEGVEVIGPPDPANGEQVFATICAGCHGPDGEGDIGPALNIPARLAERDDAWYINVVTNGRPDLGMPAWGDSLSGQDIVDVVSFIRLWGD